MSETSWFFSSVKFFFIFLFIFILTNYKFNFMNTKNSKNLNLLTFYALI